MKEKRVPENQINEKLKERITAFLEETKKQDLVDNYISKLTQKAPVEVYFKKPKLSVEVDASKGPQWGDKKAPVSIVTFSDFQCPFCSKAAETVDEVKKKYKGKVKISFRHFPLSFHPQARPAAEASMCINDQSEDKFWKFHDLVFKNQKQIEPANLEEYAKKSGADVAKYKACLESKKFADVVQQDMSYGEKIGVKSTPTFFVNGQLLNGAVPFETFAETIDDELQTKKN